MVDFELDTKKIKDMVNLEKNILIYAHQKFSTNDGGITVQYYLAYTLSKLGINTQIYNVHDKNAHNCIYNNFVDNIENIDFDNTIVIYCEGVQGNPLNAKYVVRWMLSKLGQNVPYHYYYTWNKNELVYFFNSEKEMVDNNKHFKLLTLYYFNSEIKNNNNERKGLCYTIRKKRKFKNNIDINIINNTYNLMKLPVYEITRCQDQGDYIDIFNKHEYFMTYDPYTFLITIAILCGCISIVYPIDEVSKIEYFKMTPYYEYMVEKNCFEIYGLAYGMTDEEINYAKKTLHLAKDQMIDIQNWFINKNIKQFLVDINDWSKNYNTLKNYKYSMCENIPILDIDFYRSVHEDLHDYSDVEAIDHYNNYGIHEKRLFSEKHFYDLYPNFDITFYKNIHKDLNNRSTNFLLFHYFLYGEKEERLTSKRHFYELYPEFDIDYYKSFNDEFKNMTNDQFMYHYHEFGSKINKKNLEYDFIVNDDNSLPVQNDRIKDLIFNHEYIRRIDNYEKLVEHLKQFEKKYYIYNKDSFYTYYYDFDYEYYKNKYFNNTEMKEKDILLYYHLKGKYEKHIINNKINLIMYAAPFSDTCGGIIVMHYFCKLINEKYNDRFCAKLFMHNNLKYKNPFCNNFARLDEINDNCIVIYPEIISGNPLNAKNVVRWILLELGIEMPLDHYKNWSPTDLIYHWEPIDKQLCCPFYNNIFTNKNIEKRDKTCYLVKKGRLIHENINYIHPPNSICIDDLSLKEKADIFNQCKFFYSYDPNTAYVLFSAACGCIPIIYPIENVSEEDFFKSKMFKFDGNIYNKGIVYGNNIEKINYILENKLNENNETYYKNLFTMIEKKTFTSFLEELQNLH